MAWTLEFTETARPELRSLDGPTARRILDFMEQQVALLDDPRCRGVVLTKPLGDLWRYRVGRCRVICDVRDRVLRVLLVRVTGRDQVYR